ncbi:MAG: UDP-N-acetylmuramoyl-L-alanine--D-glutamate ligase [Candidatus Saganbacteria bacterium]|nr:UDP-N-acetylmuramoyl-L-alanine--D-glutamate ligase [Candidatus Saganbacteria bacterium]
MFDLRDKKVTVFGLGKSGIAAAKRLVNLGAKVFVTDEFAATRFDQVVLAELTGLGVEIELEGHTEKTVDEADLIILSPGVHLDLVLLEEARRKSIPVISEIELAYNLLTKPIIAITGTNGKTTTTTLIGALLKEHGYRVEVVGNIGTPLISVHDQDLDYIVTEVSSYQLEGIVDFRPYISLILNITPDHLERHKTMHAYASSKANVFKNQKQGDFLVYNLDQPPVKKVVPDNSLFSALPFSRKKSLDKGMFVKRGKLIVKQKQEEEIMDKKKIFLKGEHNLENCLAAAMVARLCGVSSATIAKVLEEFRGVEHRIEYVTRIHGISFYNDSKGTNPDSTVVALKALAPRITGGRKPVVLIAGGKDKGLELLPMVKEIQCRAKAVVLLGEAKERFRDELIRAGYSDVFLESSMQSAVEKALDVAERFQF